MAWRRPGDKPLFEPMMDSLPTHICVTRPQWVNTMAAGALAPYIATQSATIILGMQINPSSSSTAYMCQWSGSALFQVMACRLFDAKPLPKSVLVYCQLDSFEQLSVKFELEFYYFHSRKCTRNCRLLKWRQFCPGRDELNHILPSTGNYFHYLSLLSRENWQKLQLFFFIFPKINSKRRVNETVGTSLCMCPANERRRYNATTSLIGWAHS